MSVIRRHEKYPNFFEVQHPLVSGKLSLFLPRHFTPIISSLDIAQGFLFNRLIEVKLMVVV